jgi:hypothetical protein
MVIKEPELWITNISKMNVTLRDLNISIPAMRSVNLISKRNGFKIEAVEKSIASGSIYAKRNKIKVRKVAPEPIKRTLEVSKEPLYTSENVLQSQVVIDNPQYEELNISDEQFFDELTNEDIHVIS